MSSAQQPVPTVRSPSTDRTGVTEENLTLVAGFGPLASGAHHGAELQAIDDPKGPLFAFVVDNLVENAAEHNDAEDPRIQVTVDRTAETVHLDVRDNGPGVRPTVIEDVEEGGLDLAATLVQQYDGTITATETEPRGSEFSVVLPWSDAD